MFLWKHIFYPYKDEYNKNIIKCIQIPHCKAPNYLIEKMEQQNIITLLSAVQ